MQDKTSPDEFFDNLQDFSTIFSDSLSEEEPPSVMEQELSEVTDRYIDENQIDKGGMKSISSVTDKMTLREVAIAKLLKTTNKSKERFISEGRLTAFLEHPNIVPVYDLGMDGDEPFFTMKLIEGESLEDLIRDLKNKPERCSIADRMQIFLKICDAVSYAHFKGVIHLDLKPANIQIGKFGEVIVCDWGLAKIIKDQSESRDFDTLDPDIYNDVTLNGMIKGSPGYMAPEQILEKRGSKDEQTDIYSLGGILYSLLTLKPPVNTDELKRSLQFTLEGAILDPQKIDSSIPAGLSAVAMKALSVEKSDRYKEVTEIRNEVNRWLNGFVTEAENAGFLTSLYLFVKRHKISCYFSAAILMISMISAAIFVIQENKTLEAQALYLQEKRKGPDRCKKYNPNSSGAS